MSFGGGEKKSMSQAVQQVATPQVKPTPASPETPSREQLRKMGRASLLISTTSQGVLGQATTGRRQLLSGVAQ